MSNDTSSRKNGLVMVVLVLWLIGLTALFIMLMKNQKDSTIEARVAKLETRASKVVGKIPKPGDTGSNNDIAMLNQRISQLELKLGELNQGRITTAAVDTSTPPVSGEPCNCNEFASRLDKLEAKVLAKKEDTGKITAAADIKPRPKKKAVRSPRKKTVKRTAKRRTPRYKKAVVARQVKPQVHEKTVSNRTESVEYTKYDKDYIGDSVYEITTRFGAMYGGYSNGELANISRLAPGAAIYPGSSTDNYGTIAKY